MAQQPLIWLASWPRSGNSLLRTVLWHCFELKSASFYENDLGGNSELERLIGHIEYDQNKQLAFPPDKPRVVKTHEYPRDNNPAIYVIRDGRAACVSLWHFYKNQVTLESVISGRHRFGSWADHVSAWSPCQRNNTLLIQYEAILNDLPGVLENLSRFLGLDIVSSTIPGRDEMASIEGRWVRKKTAWQEEMDDAQLRLFDRVNGELMEKMGFV